MTEENRSLDILGIKPIANAVQSTTAGIVSGVSAFLSRICLPAAEEFGLLLRDRVGHWRAINAASIAKHAEQLLNTNPEQSSLHAHPRIVANVIEFGSWSDAEELQHLWGGLLASACTLDGRDDSNLMFLELLAKLTVSQALLFDYVCAKSKKKIAPAGWIHAEHFILTLDELKRVTGLTDLHRIDLELDHLRTLGLIDAEVGGFNLYSTDANVTPSALALQMYVRCCGSTENPVSYYGVQNTEPPPQPPT